MTKRLGLAGLLFLAAAGLFAASQSSRQISGEFWTTLQPLLAEIERPPVDQKLVTDLFELARQVFSAMIYGYKFTYTPSDSARRVKEAFDIKLLGEIPFGDPDLRVIDTRVSEPDLRFYVRLRYFPKDFELNRQDNWNKINLPTAGGTGQALAETKLESSLQALQQAVKEAARNYLRPRDYNKPKAIRGEVLLRKVPQFQIVAGYWVCKAEFLIRIVEVESYLAF